MPPSASNPISPFCLGVVGLPEVGRAPKWTCIHDLEASFCPPCQIELCTQNFNSQGVRIVCAFNVDAMERTPPLRNRPKVHLKHDLETPTPVGFPLQTPSTISTLLGSPQESTPSSASNSQRPFHLREESSRLFQRDHDDDDYLVTRRGRGRLYAFHRFCSLRTFVFLLITACILLWVLNLQNELPYNPKGHVDISPYKIKLQPEVTHGMHFVPASNPNIHVSITAHSVSKLTR